MESGNGRAVNRYTKVDSNYNGIELRCYRCRGKFSAGGTVTFTMLRAMLDAFEAEHEDCEPAKEKPSREPADRVDEEPIDPSF